MNKPISPPTPRPALRFSQPEKKLAPTDPLIPVPMIPEATNKPSPAIPAAPRGDRSD